MQTRYHVTGMTCDHCVSHVRQEVLSIPGVEAVTVQLEGTMVVVSENLIDLAAIEEAVAEAGDYSVIPN